MPSVSEKQHNAMEAAAHGHSTLGIPESVGKEFVAADQAPIAAGIVFMTRAGDILLLRRSSTEKNYGGYWALPGGQGEQGETPETTALREASEEIGWNQSEDEWIEPKLIDRRTTPRGTEFSTFLMPVDEFEPKLNFEHSGYCWAPLDQLPRPLHPAVAQMLRDKLGAEGIAKDEAETEWKPYDASARFESSIDMLDIRNLKLGTEPCPIIEDEPEEEPGEGEEEEIEPDDAPEQIAVVNLYGDNMASISFDSAEFVETDHPRAPDGKFGSGGGSASSSSVAKTRDYTPKELDWEYDVEYKKYSRPSFPNAFSSREDFQKKFDAAPLQTIDNATLKTLGNSMAASGIGKGEEWVHKTFSHRRDSKRIVEALRNGATAPPIILKSGNRLHLMAGQTRLAAGAALGLGVKAKIIDVSKPGQAADAKFEEAKHPRDNDGKFAVTSGGADPAPFEGGGAVKPSTQIRAILGAGGFKKIAGSNPSAYINPDGVKVVLHAPMGTVYSSKFTSYKEGFSSKTGENNALAKLLNITVEKAKAKKAEAPAAPAKTEAPASPAKASSKSASGSKIPTMFQSKLKDSGFQYFDTNATSGTELWKGEAGSVLVNEKTNAWKTYTAGGALVSYGGAGEFHDAINSFASGSAEPKKSGKAKSDPKAEKIDSVLKQELYVKKPMYQAKMIYEKPSGAKISIDPESEEWVAQTPGHMKKEGTGLANLQLLLSGKPPPAGSTPPWKNSSQEIGPPPPKSQEEEVADKSLQHYNSLLKHTPTPESGESNALSSYGDGGYDKINAFLRDHPENAHSNEKVKNIDAFLKRASIPEDTVLYRGVSGAFASMLKSLLQKGTRIPELGYMSTTTNPKMGFVNGAGIKYKINVPKGSKGAAIGKHSGHFHEHEVLFARGTAMIVKSFNPKTGEVEVDLDQSHLED